MCGVLRLVRASLPLAPEIEGEFLVSDPVGTHQLVDVFRIHFPGHPPGFRRLELVGPQHVDGSVGGATLPGPPGGDFFGRQRAFRPTRQGGFFPVPLFEPRNGMHVAESRPGLPVGGRVPGVETHHTDPRFGPRRHHARLQHRKDGTRPEIEVVVEFRCRQQDAAYALSSLGTGPDHLVDRPPGVGKEADRVSLKTSVVGDGSDRYPQVDQSLPAHAIALGEGTDSELDQHALDPQPGSFVDDGCGGTVVPDALAVVAAILATSRWCWPRQRFPLETNRRHVQRFVLEDSCLQDPSVAGTDGFFALVVFAANPIACRSGGRHPFDDLAKIPDDGPGGFGQSQDHHGRRILRRRCRSFDHSHQSRAFFPQTGERRDPVDTGLDNDFDIPVSVAIAFASHFPCNLFQLVLLHRFLPRGRGKF
mmetsp:Transcript_101589/g.206313  ORF Transcript_101589/g.206313 Transcript_101589/m.206313 type:complete len:420 (+) Transcript_101589:121-1380(+)